MAEKIRLSVVIPCHDSRDTVERCLRSVLAADPAAEIVVADDASSDDTAARVEAVAAANPGRVRLLRLKENRGPATARNRGAEAARGELLFFVDSDTEMLPDALSRFVERMRTTDAVAGCYHYEPLNRGWAPRYKAMLIHYFLSRQGITPFSIFNGACGGTRRETFLALGGYNESLQWGDDYENEELGARLVKKCAMLMDPSIMVRHRFPGAGKLTRTLFLRSMLWAEHFLVGGSFDRSGITTAATGLATAALLVAAAAVPAALLYRPLWVVAALAAAVHLCGYLGFYAFAARKARLGFPVIALLNLWFALVVACGALVGLSRGAVNVRELRPDASRPNQ